MNRRQWCGLPGALVFAGLGTRLSSAVGASPCDRLPPTELVSSWTFDETLTRVASAIEGAGLTIFYRMDHAAAAAGVGLNMPATTVLLYGHPKAGTGLMLSTPLVALDLPLRVLIQERSDRSVIVAFHPIAQTLADAGVPTALSARLLPAQQLIIDAIRP